MSDFVDPSRIYVGNVNFNATEDELKEFFQDFKVMSVEIPRKLVTQGETTIERRLGFGFVQFENEAEADKAIREVSGKIFKTRSIYARKALPPATAEQKEKKREAYLAKKAEKAKKNEAIANLSLTPDASEATENVDGSTSLPKISAKKARKLRKAKELEIMLATGKKSTDIIYVSNLHNKVNKALVSELFSELHPIWVHLPLKRVPLHILRKREAEKKPILNKGFAYIKFANEETQLRAISQFNGKEIRGRNIVVDAAREKPVINKASSDSTESTKKEASSEFVEGDVTFKSD